MYKQFLTDNCMKTCDFCPSDKEEDANADCVDTVTYCDQYQAQVPGICTNSLYKAQMMSECSKTCDLCGWKGACESGGADNTMCLYPNTNLGSACTAQDSEVKTSADLDDTIQKVILDTHNKHRQEVASGEVGRNKGYVSGLPAGTIPDLQWDDGLALEAQRWMNQCTYAHDKNRLTETFPLSAGQNLYVSYYPLSNVANGYPVPEVNKQTLFAGAVNAWYDEVLDFVNKGCTTTNWNTCLGSNPGKSVIPGFEKYTAQIGHFTQVIWAKTTHVGCGWIQFQNTNNVDTIVACNYGPGGNMQGDPVYT